MSFKRLALVCPLLIPAASPAKPAVTFVTSGAAVGNFNQSVGWKFNVTSPVTVTGLGWFDLNADGLSNGHQVGIWNPSGTLLASVTVPAGTAASLDGQFRTVSIAPLVLPAAAGYIVGGENFSTTTDGIQANAASQTLDSHLTYVTATYSDTTAGGFTRPATVSGGTTSGFYGASFSVVPEPAGLSAFALAGVVLSRRLRSRRPHATR